MNIILHNHGFFFVFYLVSFWVCISDQRLEALDVMLGLERWTLLRGHVQPVVNV